jgi:hypothetical protein
MKLITNKVSLDIRDDAYFNLRNIVVLRLVRSVMDNRMHKPKNVLVLEIWDRVVK